MTPHFADRLLDAIADKGSPVCVGLDPTYERLPRQLQTPGAGPAEQVEAIRTYLAEVIEIVAPIVPAVKPQIAYFEVYRQAGLELYFETVALARRMGLVVIGDVKRGDIGSTAKAYATGHLSADGSPDAVTLNGYLGADSLAPFVDACRQTGRGGFVLVRTSNPSAAALQDFADASGKKLCEHVAEMVAQVGAGEGLIGASGYSCIGAVVGATWPEDAVRLRRLMPQQLFLLPGYGAQGATARDCTASFKSDRTGAIVSASRSVLYAFDRDEYAGKDWKQAIGLAARAFAEDMAKALR